MTTRTLVFAVDAERVRELCWVGTDETRGGLRLALGRARMEHA